MRSASRTACSWRRLRRPESDQVGNDGCRRDRRIGNSLPKGRGHAIIIGETSNVRAQRQHLLAQGLGKDQIYAEGYWRPGRIGGHDHIRDGDEEGAQRRPG